MDSVRNKTRNKILQSARVTFLKLGIVNTSMENIAKESNITRRTLYRYFKSKNNIAIEVIIEILEEFNKKQISIAKAIKSNGLEKMKYFLYTYVDYMIKNEETIKFMGEFDYFFRDAENSIKNAEVRKRFNAEINITEDILIDILQEGINDATIRMDFNGTRVLAYTISNTLWAFGQRIAIRGKQIGIEAEIHATELLYCQIDMYVEALKN